MERRKGKLTGHQVADCIVTISRMDGVESSRAITDVLPRVPDGDLQADGLRRSRQRLDGEKIGMAGLCSPRAVCIWLYAYPAFFT